VLVLGPGVQYFVLVLGPRVQYFVLVLGPRVQYFVYVPGLAVQQVGPRGQNLRVSTWGWLLVQQVGSVAGS
jgi:hypothetical protein